MRRWPNLLWVLYVVGCGHTEPGLRQDASDRFRRAQASKDAGDYEAAKDAFGTYLGVYGASVAAESMKADYGRVLAALGKHVEARTQFEAVIVAYNHRGGDVPIHVRSAAYGALRSLEHSSPVELHYKSAVAAKPFKVDRATAQTTLPMSDTASKLAKAYDRYFDLASPQQRERISMKFGAAMIYHRHRQFDQSARRFASVIDASPVSLLATRSADLALDGLHASAAYRLLERYARRFRSTAQLNPGNKTFREQLSKMIEAAAVKAAFEDARRAKAEPDLATRRVKSAAAADHLLALVQEFADSKHVRRMRIRAASLLRLAERFDDAIAIYRLVFAASRTPSVKARATAAIRETWRQANAAECVLVPANKDISDGYWSTCEDHEIAARFAEARDCYLGLDAMHIGASTARKLAARLAAARMMDALGQSIEGQELRRLALAGYQHGLEIGIADAAQAHAAADALLARLDPELAALKRITGSIADLETRARQLAEPDSESEYVKLAKVFKDPCAAVGAYVRMAQVWLHVADVHPSDAGGVNAEAKAEKALAHADRLIREYSLSNRWTAEAAALSRSLSSPPR